MATEGMTGMRKDARVVINAAAALQRTKKLRDRPGGSGGGDASQKQTFLESRYPVSRVSRYWFDTYQL